MRGTDLSREFARYRAGYLKLRSVLHDRTTKLPAYPLLLDDLRRLLDRRRCLGVLHLSIDNLEMVESLYGWQVFDRILSCVAAVLRAALDELPAGSLLGLDRVAGDQFVLFVPETHDGTEVDGPFLARTADKLRPALDRAFEADEFAGLNPSLSFRSGHSLLSINPFYRFERRVYSAVEAARMRQDRQDRKRERSLGEELRRIIDDAAIHTVFQPVVDLSDRIVVGYEAFTRGPKDTSLEMPHAMFALSSRVGVDVELDRLCRQVALRESAEVTGEGKLFINVLPVSLEDPDWQGAVGTKPGDRWSLVLDVSERGADRGTDAFVASIERLKSLGVAVSLDNIGTGFASLATLERVRPDYLKVDRTLVSNIQDNLIKQEIFSSLVQIADRIGSRVVAEGIESEEEAAVLQGCGAQYGQGFLFAGPSPAEDLGARS